MLWRGEIDINTNPFPTNVFNEEQGEIILDFSLQQIKFQTPGVDTLYPTPILRPVYCYTVLSSARSEVRGTQRPERPATIVCCTVPC
jgi:hypothetical protein